MYLLDGYTYAEASSGVIRILRRLILLGFSMIHAVVDRLKDVLNECIDGHAK